MALLASSQQQCRIGPGWRPLGRANPVTIRAAALPGRPQTQPCVAQPCAHRSPLLQKALYAPARRGGLLLTRASIALTAKEDGPPARNKYDEEIWGVALPALASMLLEPIMGVINAGMIGRLGTQQLGAVSVASMIVSFATFLFSFLLFLTTPEVAAAVVKNDKAEVSRISSKSLWVSMFFGLITTAVLLLKGPDIIARSAGCHLMCGGGVVSAVMAPPEPAVAMYASQYVAIRAWGITMVLSSFVATGTYRGFKDTKTPLYAAVGSAVCSLVLNYLFIEVLKWGVQGGALAVTLAQAVSCLVLWRLLVQKGMMRLQDMIKPPSFQSVLPMLRKGAVLGVRSIISFGMILYASALCVRAGSAYQAGFEVIRQVWMLTIQFFECLNVATQTLCAAYLGASNRTAAREVLERLLQLGMTVGAIVGVVVLAAQQPITQFFTKDPLVIAQVLATLPMVCLMFPLDAAGSIMDGSLLACKQTDYMSVVQILGSVLQLFVLLYLTTNDMVSCFSIWTTLKVLTVCRFAGGFVRNWFSAESGYLPQSSSKVVATATAASSQSVATTAIPVTPGSEAVAAVPIVHLHHGVNGKELAGAESAVRHTQDDTVVVADQGVQGSGVVAHLATIEEAEDEAVAEALALQQDMMNVDLVPGVVCCMEAAQEHGNAEWHARHDCKHVRADGLQAPAEGAPAAPGVAESELQAAQGRG